MKKKCNSEILKWLFRKPAQLEIMPKDDNSVIMAKTIVKKAIYCEDPVALRLCLETLQIWRSICDSSPQQDELSNDL